MSRSNLSCRLSCDVSANNKRPWSAARAPNGRWTWPWRSHGKFRRPERRSDRGMPGKSFMLIAGEASGDTLGAELVKALRAEPGGDQFEFFGAGGPKM